MAQQTAIEWLIDKLSNIKAEDVNSTKEVILICQQAKAMEKEQIMHSWENGALPDLLKEFKNSRIYYNETYGK